MTTSELTIDGYTRLSDLDKAKVTEWLDQHTFNRVFRIVVIELPTFPPSTVTKVISFAQNYPLDPGTGAPIIEATALAGQPPWWEAAMSHSAQTLTLVPKTTD